MLRGEWQLRLLVSVGLLLVLAWWLDPGEIMFRFAAMKISWIVLGVAISVFQVIASAWRWSFTANRLGVDLPFTTACREYYLATFLNQVLPGGVMGDVSRAWRHARSQLEVERIGTAVRAVILERASGQVVMTIVAVGSVIRLLVTLERTGWLRLLGVAVVSGVTISGLMFWLWQRRVSDDSLVRRAWYDTYAALLSIRALPIQLVSSGLIVGSYLLTFLVAARAVGVNTPFLMLLPLVAPVLVTMLFPVTIAGWGIREGAAAVLWGAVGLTAVDGVAISVGYGFLALFSSLPGSVILAIQMWRKTRPVDEG
jgi:uncharacterized membrane protein YbhN (UPF0104 family)